MAFECTWVLEQWQEAAKGSRFIDVYRIMPQPCVHGGVSPVSSMSSVQTFLTHFNPLTLYMLTVESETWLLYWPKKKSDMAWQFPKNREGAKFEKTTNAI